MNYYNFKNIHIGKDIHNRVIEIGIEMIRICNFFKCSEDEIIKMYDQKSLNSDILIKWSKLLDYDFFRIYSHHLILYSPHSAEFTKNKQLVKSKLPEFKKSLYTREIIQFVIEMINTGKKTRQEVIKEYRIPKTTLYKWLQKYNNEQEQ